jgi:hypothetical protein
MPRLFGLRELLMGRRNMKSKPGLVYRIAAVASARLFARMLTFAQTPAQQKAPEKSKPAKSAETKKEPPAAKVDLNTATSSKVLSPAQPKPRAEL